MSKGSYEDFRDALRAFESGWDRERYENGQIADWQLDQWAGGSVQDFYPQYSSWGELTEQEWEVMSYRSTNSLGFVGYQFGEALLIDLGYYQDDSYYGAGESTNLWDGTWTGKNGVNSLEEFMTKEAQEIAIQEAFGFNLLIIEEQLQVAGRTLDEFIGQTITYTDIDGSQVDVTLSISGIMAGAHLRGAYGTVNLLLGGNVSTDENGTSILRYIDTYGGYDSPTAEEAIDYYEDRLIGTERPIGPGGQTVGGGTANVTKEEADVVVTWSYGNDEVVQGFNPAEDTIFVDWFDATALDVSELNGNVIFAVPSNVQTLTLQGITLAELSPGNFTIMDESAAEEILALIGEDASEPEPDLQPEPDPEPPLPDPEEEPPVDHPDNSHGDQGALIADDFVNPDITAGNADIVVTWAWGQQNIIEGFDPASNTIFVDWIDSDSIDFREVMNTETGGTDLLIEVPGNNQSIRLVGVRFADLEAENIHMNSATAREELAMLINGAGSGQDDGNHGDHGDENDHGDNNDHGDGDHDGEQDHQHHEHMHVTLTLNSEAQIIEGFMPSMGDVIEIGSDIAAENFSIFEESGDALGQTVRIELTDAGDTRQIVFTGFGLDDLTIANFSIDDQGVFNEVTAALGVVVIDPEGEGGYTLTYDSDGSSPPDSTGTTEKGGIKYRADSNADDIVGFDPSKDEIDLGGTSVHGMIITKSPAGEIVIDSPWSEAAQIVQGVTFDQITIESFGIVGNEHFRQDLGGVVSWEQGIGPREADTIYIRSHEYGVHEVVNDFDPATMKISFLYFGTRERLSVEDSDAGLVISSLPSGQSMTLTGVSLADLVPGQVEFHFDQVMEDNLETPFGFDQNEITLVSREALLTPQAPAGQSTDGDQTRQGDFGGQTSDEGLNGDEGEPDDETNPTLPDSPDVFQFADGAIETVELEWAWGAQSRVDGFNPAEDLIDVNTLSGTNLEISELDGDLLIEIIGNGGNITVLSGIQAEDLSIENFRAEDWNDALDPSSTLMQQLSALGMDI